MPIISHFYGIVIRMYFNDNEQHNTPHFHAKYAGREAAFDFDGKLLAGKIPPKQKQYIAVWADIHRKELEVLWEMMQTEDEYFKIKGLD